MPLPADPTRVICPVLSYTPGTSLVHEIWGTAFFIAPQIVMSAKHVLGASLPEGHALGILLHENDRTPMVPLTDIYLDPDYDIGIARGSAPHQAHLNLAPSDLMAMNSDILSVEYSDTRQHVLQNDGTTEMRVIASYHKGHVVRRTEEGLGQRRPTKCIDLSFPALRGASGAPVVTNENDALVLGLIVANVARHLMPAQIARTVIDGEDHEEIKYFLPYGQAIRAVHLWDTAKASGLLPLPTTLTTGEC